MSKNLKELIDGIEKEEFTRAQLEKQIEKLIAENIKLQTKIDDLKPKTPIGVKQKKAKESQEIEILKNLVSSQKLEIQKRDEKINNYQLKIDDLDSSITKLKTEVESHESKMVEESQKSMENLLNEYQRIENLNIELRQRINEFENEKLGIIQKKQHEMEDLESVISEFEIENKKLKNELNSLRMKQRELADLSIENENLNTLNVRLEKEIELLKQEKEIIKDKDAILLAKTITAMNIHEKPKLKTPNTKEIAELDIFSKEKGKEIENETDFISSPKIELPKPHKNIKELIKEEIINGNSPEIIKRKWECPNCGNINKSQIREIPDKSRVIYAGPGGNMYAKKYKCGLCASEWH